MPGEAQAMAVRERDRPLPKKLRAGGVGQDRLVPSQRGVGQACDQLIDARQQAVER